MATVGIERKQPASAGEMCTAKSGAKQGEGLRQYYLQHIHELQLNLRQKTHNLNRLEAQRNELNSRGPLTLILFSLTRFIVLIFFSSFRVDWDFRSGVRVFVEFFIFFGKVVTLVFWSVRK